MSVWQARKGESKPCVVVQEVLAVWFARTRARPGETVKLGAIVKDVKDGSKVDFAIVYKGEVLATKEGAKLSGGKAEAEWKIELPEREWPNEVELELDCTVGDKIKSRPSQRPKLLLDLGLPAFSV